MQPTQFGHRAPSATQRCPTSLTLHFGSCTASLVGCIPLCTYPDRALLCRLCARPLRVLARRLAHHSSFWFCCIGAVAVAFTKATAGGAVVPTCRESAAKFERLRQEVDPFQFECPSQNTPRHGSACSAGFRSLRSSDSLRTPSTRPTTLHTFPLTIRAHRSILVSLSP